PPILDCLDKPMDLQFYDWNSYAARVLRIAASIFWGPGTYARSSAGENGTGAWGGVTISIGACSDRIGGEATGAAMSAAILHRGGLSSAMIRRPVFSTLSRMLSSSNGDVVRGSIRSHRIPSFASASTAFSANGTMRASATTVAASPSRSTLASP